MGGHDIQHDSIKIASKSLQVVEMKISCDLECMNGFTVFF